MRRQAASDSHIFGHVSTDEHPAGIQRNQFLFFEIPCSIGTYRNIISREHPSRKVAGSCLAQKLTLVNVGAKYDEPSLLYIMNNNLDQHGGSHSDEERFLLASSGYAPFPPVISSHCVLI